MIRPCPGPRRIGDEGLAGAGANLAAAGGCLRLSTPIKIRHARMLPRGHQGRKRAHRRTARDPGAGQQHQARRQSRYLWKWCRAPSHLSRAYLVQGRPRIPLHREAARGPSRKKPPSRICEHQRRRSTCKECRGESVGEHQRIRSKNHTLSAHSAELSSQEGSRAACTPHSHGTRNGRTSRICK